MEFITDLLYGYPSFLGQCYRGLCPNLVKEDFVIVPDAGMAGVSDSVPPEKIESPGSGAPGHLQDVVKCVEIGRGEQPLRNHGGFNVFSTDSCGPG